MTVVGHAEIMLELSWKLSSCWLVFTVPEVVIQVAKG